MALGSPFLWCRNFLLALFFISAVNAYIPASPTNDTNSAIASGLNVTDVSKLDLEWYKNGSYSINVAYELVGNGSLGITQGALVHFNELGLTNETTTTPWIALVSCDANATDASQVDDIFTLARDRGAVSALLYSLYSSACIINPYYSNPQNFDQVFDIFSTQSLTSAQLIEYQFISINKTLYSDYDPQRLNGSFAIINSTMGAGYSTGAGYMFATLRAYNATGPNITSNGANPDSNSSQSGQTKSKTTSLAMIILYAITGCVSALFVIVIVSGAIRAIRHPERYGPRRGDSSWQGAGIFPQSRAKGLTRAILDTFPIVKFDRAAADEHSKDLEQQTAELTHWEVVDTPKVEDSDDVTRMSEETMTELGEADQIDEQNRASVPDEPVHVVAQLRATSTAVPDVSPAAIGRETCPICIVDFEEGDDLRVLPCEGKHRFHQECVDQWLLELSSSCPICREDFYALEAIISGEREDVENTNTPTNPSARGRFSRYLRFARRRARRDNEHSGDYDPTYPPVPPPQTL